MSTDTYYQDDQSPILVFLLLFMTFFMSIHLLNMLIAMMGESFTTNHEAGDAKKKQSQITFVVDNWYMDPIPSKDKIVYIIAASHLEHEDVSDAKFLKLHNQIDSVMVQQ